jgi:hypothetical protein
MTHSFGLMIESMVSLLLALTIIYCALLNRQIRRLKTDESLLKATIAELMQATGLAERAIAGLKLTVKECDQGLGERLRAAEQLSANMDKQIDAGEVLLERFTRLVAAAAQPKVPDAKSIAAAAQAFTDRARSRAQSLAA